MRFLLRFGREVCLFAGDTLPCFIELVVVSEPFDLCLQVVLLTQLVQLQHSVVLAALGPAQREPSGLLIHDGRVGCLSFCLLVLLL